MILEAVVGSEPAGQRLDDGAISALPAVLDDAHPPGYPARTWKGRRIDSTAPADAAFRGACARYGAVLEEHLIRRRQFVRTLLLARPAARLPGDTGNPSGRTAQEEAGAIRCAR